LRFYAARFGCAVHAYCLMTNHVHLLMTPHQADACALVMKQLWEGRFRSCLVGSEQYALACYRYIELNPVRARIVARPREYRWSSYGANAEGRRDEMITPHPAYCGLAEGPARRHLADMLLLSRAK